MTNNELSAFALVVVLAIASVMVSVPYGQSSNEPQPSASPVKLSTVIETSTSTNCLSPELANGAQIRVLGAYEGGIETQLSIEGNSHQVGRIKLHAGVSGGPVILVLSAYDPVIWDFSEFPVDRVRGVLATGYHDQAVAGLPANIPLRINSHDTPNAQCGDYSYAYQGGSDLDRLVGNIAVIFGREPDSFQGDYDPKSFNIDGQLITVKSDDNLGSSNDIRATKNIFADPIASKKTGLVQLINAGKIRPANANDVSALSRALTAASPSGKFAPIKLDSSVTHELYVILAPTTLPRGMYGGNLANFIIPAGVPMPIDPGSHNTYFRLADGSCMGTMCDR